MRKIYILPNLFTTGNFFCGVVALSLIFQEKFIPAAFIIILAMVFDFIDGQVARLYRVTSRFGVEYDSLADFLTFGVATTFLIYRMFLVEMGRLGIGLAFLYSVFCALRLARFNTQVKKEEKTNFTGLPSPISAGVLVSYILLINRYSLPGWEKAIPFIMVFLSYLMISTYTYPTLISLRVRGKKPFLYLVGLVLGLAILIFWAELGLFSVFVGYMILGLIQSRRQRIRKKSPAPRKLLHWEKHRSDSDI